MKDLETMVPKETKTSAIQQQNDKMKDLRRMHNYKGFAVEPICGGYVVVIYGKVKTIYLSGPTGGTLSDNPKDARAFRTPKFAHEIIDEIIEDYDEWVTTLGARAVKPNDLINFNRPF